MLYIHPDTSNSKCCFTEPGFQNAGAAERGKFVMRSLVRESCPVDEEWAREKRKAGNALPGGRKAGKGKRKAGNALLGKRGRGKIRKQV